MKTIKRQTQIKYTLLPAFTAILIIFSVVAQVQATDLTVVSLGGANTAAQAEAFYKPWQQAGNGAILSGVWNDEVAKIKAMVDTNSVNWNLVEMEMQRLVRGCEEGLFVALDAEQFLNPVDFLDGTLDTTACGVGFFIWSMVIAYDASRLTTAPTGWTDFWDIEKFPGKRSMRKSANFTLEFALMADKVLATPAGQDRAFAKLDEIKPYIQWWEAGAQAPQFLASGDVVMASVYSGRIYAVRNSSQLKIVWNGGIYDIGVWGIPRGAGELEAAKRFMAFSLNPHAQKAYAERIGYGPVSKKAMELMDSEVLNNLPTAPANIAVQIPQDVFFWADWAEQLEQRFNAWAAK